MIRTLSGHHDVSLDNHALTLVFIVQFIRNGDLTIHFILLQNVELVDNSYQTGSLLHQNLLFLLQSANTEVSNIFSQPLHEALSSYPPVALSQSWYERLERGFLQKRIDVIGVHQMHDCLQI